MLKMPVPYSDPPCKIFSAEAELVTARHEEQMRRMDRELREEQDLEFQRTMEADRLRMEELKRQQEEEELKAKQAEEKENLKIRRQTEHRVSHFPRLKRPIGEKFYVSTPVVDYNTSKVAPFNTFHCSLFGRANELL